VREADEAVAGVVAADSVAAAGDSAAAEADSIAELARVLAAAAQTFRAGALRLEVPSVAKGAGVPGRVIETRDPTSRSKLRSADDPVLVIGLISESGP
jgi:hypothetical protein